MASVFKTPRRCHGGGSGLVVTEKQPAVGLREGASGDWWVTSDGILPRPCTGIDPFGTYQLTREASACR